MARLRKFVAYRRIERPYTRVSKFRSKSYVKSRPHLKITRFDMGNLNGSFEYRVSLVSKQPLQIRQESIESARISANRLLEKTLGSSSYHFKILKYPHHVLRENPLASGAGADRLSTGMKLSFGKVIGIAVQLREGERLMSVYVNKDGIEKARRALRLAYTKLPLSYSIVEEKA